MRKIYASEDMNRAIMVDDENGIIKSFGLNNVLCCESEGLIETEELIEVSNTNFEWTEEVSDKLTFKGLLTKYGMTFNEIAKEFDIPYRTAQNWHLETRKCPEYVIKMMDTIFTLEAH